MRYLFIVIMALANIFFIKDFSLSFFLFNMLVFTILFFPYHQISSIKQMIFNTIIIIITSYFFLFFIFLIKNHETYPKNLPLNKENKIAYVKSDYKKKDHSLQDQYYTQVKKQLFKPSTVSFLSNPTHWYKDAFYRLYNSAIDMVQYSLFKMFVLSLVALVFSIFLLSSKIPVVSCAYAYLVLMFLPLLFRWNFYFFSQNIVKYNIIVYSIITLIVIFSFLKLNGYRKNKNI